MTPSPPTLTLEKSFTDEQLARIRGQAAVYMCACPAQVCQTLSQQRTLFSYQAQCINDSSTDKAVHTRIAESIQRTHRELEQCLHDVLILEGWDIETLKMPELLFKRLAAEVTKAD